MNISSVHSTEKLATLKYYLRDIIVMDVNEAYNVFRTMVSPLRFEKIMKKRNLDQQIGIEVGNYVGWSYPSVQSNVT